MGSTKNISMIFCTPRQAVRSIAKQADMLFACLHCRLRVSLSAAHTAEDVQRLAAAIKECNLNFLSMDKVPGSTAEKAAPGKLVAKL